MTVLIAHKASTEDRASTTTLANDTDLVVAVSANTTYIVEGYIGSYSVDIGGVRTRAQWDFTLPAGASGEYGFWGASNGSAAGNGVRTYSGGDNVLSWTTNVVLSGPSTAYTTHWIHGTLVVGGTAGNFQFRWAQATSSANISQIFAGSFLMLTSV